MFTTILTIMRALPIFAEKLEHGKRQRYDNNPAVREKKADVYSSKERITIFAASLRRKDILQRTPESIVPTGKFW